MKIDKYKFIVFPALALACISLLLIMSYFSYNRVADEDLHFMQWYQSSFNFWLWDKTMQEISVIGNEFNWVVAMLGASIVCLVYRKWLASLLVLSSSFAYAASYVMKLLIHKPR